MTPFKERMNLYRAYREQNPDKNYWDWKASIDNAGKLAQQLRTRTNKPNFVRRLEDPNRQTIPSWEDDTSVATHRLSYATYDDGSAVIYPEVQQIGNELYDFTDPVNRQTRGDAYQSALNRGDVVWVPTEQDAIDFTTQYKNYYPTFPKGSPEVPAMQNGGETTDQFIAQFGDAVTYGKDNTNLIGDISNWWNDLTGMKNYGYGYCAITPNGKLTTQCAKYSNDILRDQGYKNITGDAWNRAAYSNMKPIISGYTGLKKPNKYTKDAAHEYLRNAANNFAENVDTTQLITNDVIGIYYPDSPNTQKAFEGGQWGETQTHTGHTIVGKDGTHYVVHNVDGHLKINKLADMLTGKYDYLPVSAYRPRK